IIPDIQHLDLEACMRWGVVAVLFLTIGTAAMTVTGRAQAGRAQFSTEFTREEFAGRRARIAEAIGSKAVALVQGAPSVHSSALCRQSNEFFYVSGVTVPQAYLLVDGATRKSTLYLPHRDERRAATEGDLITAEDAPKVTEMTGIEQVRGIDQLADDLKGRG